MGANTLVPFIVQLLVEVPDCVGYYPKTGTATGSDQERGDNDKD